MKVFFWSNKIKYEGLHERLCLKVVGLRLDPLTVLVEPSSHVGFGSSQKWSLPILTYFHATQI